MALTSDQITAQNFADFYQKILPYLNGGGMGMKLLWENANPTSAFAAQNIALANSDYDQLTIQYATGSLVKSVTISKGDSALLDMAWSAASSGSYMYNEDRYMTYIDSTHYAVGAGRWQAPNVTSSTADNTRCIPLRVYGIKVYNRDVPGKTTLLWSNPSPTSAFAAQNITLANSDYDMYEILFAYISSGSTIACDLKALKGYGVFASYRVSSDNYERDVAFTDATHLAIDNAKKNGGTNDNTRLIPIVVYGIKL